MDINSSPSPNSATESKQQQRNTCKTLRTLIATNARLTPHHTAIISAISGTSYSYVELLRHVDAYAYRLERLGLPKGAGVSFLLGNGIATVELMLAAMVAGFRCTPINPEASTAQLKYVLEHSEAVVLFIAAAYNQQLHKILTVVDIPVLVIKTDAEYGPDWPTLKSNITNTKNLAAVNSDDDALLIYTSGTTGNPKGVLLTHQNLIAGGYNVSIAHQLHASDKTLCVLPLCHINAQVVSIFGTLVSGSTVVIAPRFSISRFWMWIADYQCSWFSVVPTIISRLLKDSNTPQETLLAATIGLRFVRSASAPLAPSLHRKFEQRFGVRIIETMGITETAAPLLSNPMPPQPIRVGSAGIAFGNQVRITGSNGSIQPAGVEGEIVVRGDNVMRGYFKDVAATAAAFDVKGWFKSGDIGYMDVDGYVFVTGRIKELIIKGGENISPREIDDALYGHPAVVEACAAGIADDDYGEVVIAAVVLHPQYIKSTSLESELINYCAQQVGEFKAPQTIYFLPNLPKSASGKIQRRKLFDWMYNTKT